jgi:hypothetical protein
MLAHDADIPIPYSSQQPIPFVRNPTSTNVIGGGSFRREGCLSGLVAMAPLQPRRPLGYPPEPSGRAGARGKRRAGPGPHPLHAFVQQQRRALARILKPYRRGLAGVSEATEGPNTARKDVADGHSKDHRRAPQRPSSKSAYNDPNDDECAEREP